MAGDSDLLRNLKSLRDEIFLVLSTQAKERENQRRERENAKLNESKFSFQNQRNLRISPTPEIPPKNRKVSIYSIINSGRSYNYSLNPNHKKLSDKERIAAFQKKCVPSRKVKSQSLNFCPHCPHCANKYSKK